ncbi:MAG TPA: PAS domain S-box protein [Chloroflexi bacterium]|nr:PAS domain S-box protein [Chloroflexota bacterium]
MGNKLYVLLIEDDPEYALLIQALLGVAWDIPFCTQHADSLAKGLEHLTARDFDVILLDLSLSDSSGIHTFTRVYAQAPDIPIILLSGLDDKTLAMRAVREGAQDYLVKGWAENEQLVRSIRYAIERKRFEEQLRFQAQLLDSVRESVIATDLQGRVTYWSKGAEALYGYSSEEALGHPITLIVESSAEEEESRMQQVMEAGVWSGEYVQRRKDGSTFWADAVISLVTDGMDRPSGMIGIHRDITERKLAEEELEQRNKELLALNTIATTISQSLDVRNMLEVSLRQVLNVIDIDAGWIQLVDGYAEQPPLVIHRVSSPPQMKEWATTALGPRVMGKLVQSEQPIVVPDISAEPWINDGTSSPPGIRTLVCVPIQSNKKVLGALGIFSQAPRPVYPPEVHLLTAIGHQIGAAIDNARLVQEAAEIEILQEVDHLRSELIANVSHELRTPLGLIKIFCTTLMRDDVDLDLATQLEFLHDIGDEADKLEKIVDNLLDLSRMESGRFHLEKQATDMGQMAQEVIEDMQMEIRPVHHRFIHDFPPRACIAHVDPKRIEQVLRNLLSNAIKYSPQGGDIVVSGRGDKRQLLLWVSDQGIGISPQDLECVFDRFYRAEHPATRHVRGAGLGLAVCRGIVEAHGGRIWAESTPDQGSSFYFTLPIGGQDAPTPTEN